MYILKRLEVNQKKRRRREYFGIHADTPGVLPDIFARATRKVFPRILSQPLSLHTHTHTHTHTYIYIYTCIYMYIYICIF